MDTVDQLQTLPPLDRLKALRELQEQLPALVRQAGLEARAEGVTWREIAEAGQFASLEAARHTITDASKGRDRPGLTDDLPGVGVAEAARRLGITRQQVYARIRDAKLEVEVHTSPGGRPMRRIVSPLPEE